MNALAYHNNELLGVNYRHKKINDTGPSRPPKLSFKTKIATLFIKDNALNQLGYFNCHFLPPGGGVSRIFFATFIS
jgi:hypothetical protein